MEIEILKDVMTRKRDIEHLWRRCIKSMNNCRCEFHYHSSEEKLVILDLGVKADRRDKKDDKTYVREMDLYYKALKLNTPNAKYFFVSNFNSFLRLIRSQFLKPNTMLTYIQLADERYKAPFDPYFKVA
jgi:hypothetical protein